jgi:hypothetical protein
MCNFCKLKEFFLSKNISEKREFLGELKFWISELMKTEEELQKEARNFDLQNHLNIPVENINRNWWNLLQMYSIFPLFNKMCNQFLPSQAK